MLILILIVLLVLALVGGQVGQPRWGYVGWSPLGIILVILLVLFLMGRLH